MKEHDSGHFSEWLPSIVELDHKTTVCEYPPQLVTVLLRSFFNSLLDLTAFLSLCLRFLLVVSPCLPTSLHPSVSLCLV